MHDSDDAPRMLTEPYYARLDAVERSHWYVAGMRHVARALLDVDGLRSPGLVLDAGCGTGGTLAWLRREFPRSRPVGIDLAPEALGYVEGHGTFPIAQASVIRLPFRSSSFDLVLSFDVLQHVPESNGDVGRALREAARVLRPGGSLIVRAASRRWGDPTDVVSEDGYHRYRLGELVQEIRAVGFTVRRATPVNCLGSLLDDARRFLRRSGPGHGRDPGLTIRPPRRRLLGVAQRLVMRGEALYLRYLGRRLPSGHTLLVVATKGSRSESG